MDLTDILIVVLVGILTITYFVWKQNTAAPGPKPIRPINNNSNTSSNTNNSSTTSLSFIDKMKNSDKQNIAILFYGSQTGTAEDLATRFAKDLTETYGIHTIVCDFEEYDMEKLEDWPSNDENINKGKYLACFFMATYGEGEPTDNAADFYEWVMNGQGKGADEGTEDDHMTDAKIFQDMSFVTFGLGNKTYEHFNAMVRRLDRRLTACGATRIATAGEGDDDGSLEEDFLTWKETALNDIAGYFNVIAVEKQDLPHIPIFHIKQFDGPTDKIFYGEISIDSPRRWKKVDLPSVSEDFEIIESRADETFQEIKSSNPLSSKLGDRRHSSVADLSADMKHPFYSKIAFSKTLFEKNYDEFKFEKGASLPKPIQGVYDVQGGTNVQVLRQCYHIDLDIENSGLQYKTGDHVGVWAENDPVDVERIAKVLKLSTTELDVPFTMTPNPNSSSASSVKMPFPLPCTYRTALSHYLDLRVHIKQYHCETFAKYALDAKEKETMIRLSKDRDLFVNAVEKPQKTLIDMLEEFSSIEIPVSVVLGEILPRNNLRYYSISSSSAKEPNKVGITAVVVRYAIELPKVSDVESSATKGGSKVITRQGLMTSYLQRLHNQRNPGQFKSSSEEDTLVGGGNIIPKFYLPMYIRTSHFKLPPDPTTPIIMVGPGTGAAPFRGFLWERFTQACQGTQVGATVFFFGCRNPDLDWLYKDEIELMTERVKTWKTSDKSERSEDEVDAVPYELDIVTAFSRVPNQPKVYVQQRLLEDSTRVWDILENQKGYFYVCGDAKNMATAVHNALGTIAIKCGGCDEDNSKVWVKNLKSSGRYLEDTWS